MALHSAWLHTQFGNACVLMAWLQRRCKEKGLCPGPIPIYMPSLGRRRSADAKPLRQTAWPGSRDAGVRVSWGVLLYSE